MLIPIAIRGGFDKKKLPPTNVRAVKNYLSFRTISNITSEFQIDSK